MATYTIHRDTVQSIARLRELQVARMQVADIKEYGRITTASDSANQAVVQFRNGSVESPVLPVRRIAAWAALLPAVDVAVTITDKTVQFARGGSQATFLRGYETIEGDPVIVDAGAGTEFKLVGGEADETELAAIKSQLAAVRKSAKFANELRLARENYRKQFGVIRGAANRVTEARLYLSRHAISEAVQTAKQLRNANRLARRWTKTLRQYNPETPTGLNLTGEEKSALSKLAADFALATKRNWGVKRFTSAMQATNLLVDAAARLIGKTFPAIAPNVHVNHVREKFPSITATIGVYEYDLQQYSGHRRCIRQWPTVRTELSTNYKLALARLRKAEGCE